ncbi:MAG: leucine-rich repeat domain-containing protein, partial [Bacteroidales bacterium]|nr:leucine-rich repeat domain-containing protein [Bacteroidales bacterium]
MNKIYKFLSLAVLLSLATTARAHDFEVDGIYYNITSETDLTVAVTYRGSSSTSYDYEYTGAVTIPQSVTYGSRTYSVTSIGSSAFERCSNLTSITIPSSVTSIGNKAFYWCFGLTSVKVDEGNKVYDSREGCNAIIETATNTLLLGCKSTIIASSVTSIGDYAFGGCIGLTSITIPSSVTSIGSGAFDDCRGLTSVKVDEGNKVYDSRE